mmetsp:Transcript_31631/g.51347  ORF Transcript_31631/g.51347 Transcript_31631/m.51347 type:complete len:115 (-) Transcript_31631:356-700(-)
MLRRGWGGLRPKPKASETGYFFGTDAFQAALRLSDGFWEAASRGEGWGGVYNVYVCARVRVCSEEKGLTPPPSSDSSTNPDPGECSQQLVPHAQVTWPNFSKNTKSTSGDTGLD